MSRISKYGLSWEPDTDALAIEMFCIQKDGQWTEKGKQLGLGLSHHYERMRKLLWPNLDTHRWHTLTRDEVLKNKVTVLMGPKSSGKTHCPAWLYLCEYFCFPDETCVLVSSTDIRGLELRVWGEIKTLFSQAKDRYEHLPGYLIDSKHCITTDSVDEDSVRDLRKGIIGIPCVQNGKFVGLGKYCGIKQKRMRLIADEAQYMGGSFLSAFSNLDGNEDFRAVVLGNPSDILDPLGKAAEPKEGWGSHLEPTKTDVWDTRFMNGRCVNLVGTDSPNFDYPETEPTRFKYLISREKIANTLSFFPKDSVEYYSQCVGVMKIGMMEKRVITRDMCRKYQALEDVIWSGKPRTRIAALDAAYGGDRCVLGWGEFGENNEGHMILKLHPPVIVPILVNSDRLPEEQIAEYCKQYCEANHVPPENFYHDSTGKGTLGTSLARVWSNQANPVEFGGTPTDRPVSMDLFVTDAKTGQRRLALCSEYYVKFVTELWFSVRYLIEAGQLRGLQEDVMDEGCMREWDEFNGKKRLETKSEMKERTSRSPDLFDQLAILVEGARRRGLQIRKLSNQSVKGANPIADYLDTKRKKQKELIRKQQLTYA